MPLDRSLLKFLDHVPVAGDSGGADVVKHQPHLHPAIRNFG
jgi:hypothetical protein